MARETNLSQNGRIENLAGVRLAAASARDVQALEQSIVRRQGAR